MTKEKHNLNELEDLATRLRLHVVNMVAPSGQGYVQQGLGGADIFTSYTLQKPPWTRPIPTGQTVTAFF